jgi:hypothetical protein
MDVSPAAVAVVSRAAVVRELASALADAGLPASDPVPARSPADALDAPIGPDEIDQLYEIVTVMLETGATVSTFAAHLNRVLRHHDDASAVLHDPRSGREQGHAAAATSVEQIEAMVGS